MAHHSEFGKLFWCHVFKIIPHRINCHANAFSCSVLVKQHSLTMKKSWFYNRRIGSWGVAKYGYVAQGD